MTSERQRIAAEPRLGRAIRALRRRNGLTLTQLSERSGLSVPFLSQVENNRTNPSLHSLSQIAHALRCSTNDILDAIGTEHAIEISTAPSSFDDAERSLIPAREGIEMRETRRRAGGGIETEAHPHDCVVYVARGAIELVVAAARHQLNSGDSVVVPTGVPYSWTASDGDCAVITARLGDRTVRPGR